MQQNATLFYIFATIISNMVFDCLLEEFHQAKNNRGLIVLIFDQIVNITLQNTAELIKCISIYRLIILKSSKRRMADPTINQPILSNAFRGHCFPKPVVNDHKDILEVLYSQQLCNIIPFRGSTPKRVMPFLGLGLHDPEVILL